MANSNEAQHQTEYFDMTPEQEARFDDMVDVEMLNPTQARIKLGLIPTSTQVEVVHSTDTAASDHSAHQSKPARSNRPARPLNWRERLSADTGDGHHSVYPYVK